jgi:hypothetical protein
MNATATRPTLAGEITPERFANLTRHLRVNGKPLESMLFRLQAERRGEARPVESATP